MTTGNCAFYFVILSKIKGSKKEIVVVQLYDVALRFVFFIEVATIFFLSSNPVFKHHDQVAVASNCNGFVWFSQGMSWVAVPGDFSMR